MISSVSTSLYLMNVFGWKAELSFNSGLRLWRRIAMSIHGPAPGDIGNLIWKLYVSSLGWLVFYLQKETTHIFFSHVFPESFPTQRNIFRGGEKHTCSLTQRRLLPGSISHVPEWSSLFFSAGFGNTDSILRTEQGVPGSLERGLPGQERRRSPQKWPGMDWEEIKRGSFVLIVPIQTDLIILYSIYLLDDCRPVLWYSWVTWAFFLLLKLVLKTVCHLNIRTVR